MNRPFDKAKYEALLEGLEISEILFSELHEPFRIESDYYKKEYLKSEHQIRQLPHKALEDISIKVSDGTHFTPNYTETGVPYSLGIEHTRKSG